MGFLQGYGFDRGASDRGLSSALWDDLGIDGTINNPEMGQFWIDDFCTPSTDATGVYTSTLVGSGTFANDVTTSAGCIGVGLLDAVGTSQGDAVNHQATEGPFSLAAAGTKLYFEARFKIEDLATTAVMFMGLNVIDTSVFNSSSAFTTSDTMGFYIIADDGALLFNTIDASGTDSASTTSGSLVDDTYIKVGFTCDGISGANSIRQYINGVEATTVTWAADPDISTVMLVPTAVIQSPSTTDPIMHLDWWAVGAKDYSITP